MTPALLDPKALAGAWTLTGPGSARCTLTLKAEPAANGPGMALEAGDCARIGGLPLLGGWEASNDGFGLVAADRSAVLFFSNEGDGVFAARARDGTRYELRRAER